MAHYPWTKTPLIASAPMLNIAKPNLAVSVSSAGGLGFLAAGFDVSNLEQNLEEAAQLIKSAGPSSPINRAYSESGFLPIGVGFLNWGANLTTSIAAVEKYKPCAVWFFGADSPSTDLVPWAEGVRRVTSDKTKIWVQIGSVEEAVAVLDSISPDGLIVQGSDAGGHGLAQSASVITLVPEVCDVLEAKRCSHVPVLAAGGITDGRGLAAALALGASGVAVGTRFLTAKEANVPPGYRAEVLRASDGGRNTVRSTVYDRVRGFGGLWPRRYDGRGVINRSYSDAVENGMPDSENKRLYEEEMKKGDLGWGPEGRLTTYAGTGVGLVKDTLPAADIIGRMLSEAHKILPSRSQ